MSRMGQYAVRTNCRTNKQGMYEYLAYLPKYRIIRGANARRTSRKEITVEGVTTV